MTHTEILHLDWGTRTGRKSMLRMTLEAVQEARDHLEMGNDLQALEALVWAAKLRETIIPKYIVMRREILNDRRYNVCPR